MYKNYDDFLQKQYIPNKDKGKHIGLDTSDIKGSKPRNVRNPKGVKRVNFFPNDDYLNIYYNKESIGGNVSPKGHMQYDYTTKQQQPHDKVYTRRHFPEINPPLGSNA